MKKNNIEQNRNLYKRYCKKCNIEITRKIYGNTDKGMFCGVNCANKYNRNKPWLGKKRDKKTIEKMSLAAKGRPSWNQGVKGEEYKKHFKNGIKGTFKKGHIPKNWKGGCRTYYQDRARKTMEEKIGRKLKPGETVHHLDLIKNDNHPDNLYLFKNQSEHMDYHGMLRCFVREILND